MFKWSLARCLTNVISFAVNVQYIIATTKLINGRTFLHSLSEPLEPKEIS